MKAIRWSDNDRYWGPFTYSGSDYKKVALVLGSGTQEHPKCRLRISVWRYTLIAALPQIIKPWKQWVDTSHYEWSKGEGGYWDEHQREYGFSYWDGFLQVFLGARTHDSSTTQSWSKHLPWTQWRHVRHSLYDVNGKHYATLPDLRLGYKEWEERQKIEDSCPSAKFAFTDYDGQKITATTVIDEREWRFGTGYFKWLSAFRKPKIRRSLNLKFSSEVGPDKGSWKGGTVGHSIDMLPDELHEAAFRRYCEQEHRSKSRKFRIQFVGATND